jgi:hypothetical protein
MQVSRRMGVTLSDAVVSALEEKLRETGKPINRTRVAALVAKLRGMPVLDGRTPDEILDYVHAGAPR